MNAWRSRLLTNATLLPSGDHTIAVVKPRGLRSGRGVAPESSAITMMLPWALQAISRPDGASAYGPTLPALRGAPPPGFTTHMARSTPFGSAAGFAPPPPRT